MKNIDPHIWRCFFIVFVLFLSNSCGIKKSVKNEPDKNKIFISENIIEKISDSIYFSHNGSLRKNSYGQWELVATGKNPMDLGSSIGSLSSSLVKNQESIFFDKVDELVPSNFNQKFLRKFLAWYTRKMYLYVNEEYKEEIYGISQYLSDKYDFVANKYQRSMYLHAAHDIGHALQDLALVGCSSFALWGDNTKDGKLLIARNLDFYIGDDFAKEKVISFIWPNKGYKFVSVSWAGFVGVMSGMNEKGLTVTINAGKSDIPLTAKTPISIVAREIVQYASNIHEAIEIAKNKEVFVSESIMIGSAQDNKAVLIEISPEKFGVYEVNNSSKLICSNHFQSDTYISDENNQSQIKESHSQYRYERMNELLNKSDKITPKKAVDILRNRKGLKNIELGYGNEKALNQLIAHHGVVFVPSKKMIWVSANPYQLGEFVAFQLDSVFKNSGKKAETLSIKEYLIDKDPFVFSKEFKKYESYKIEKSNIIKATKNNTNYSTKKIENFINLNPNSWEVYYLAGRYLFEKKYYKASLIEFQKALKREIPSIPEKKIIEDHIKKIKRKLHDS